MRWLLGTVDVGCLLGTADECWLLGTARVCCLLGSDDVCWVLGTACVYWLLGTAVLKKRIQSHRNGIQHLKVVLEDCRPVYVVKL